MRVDREDLVRRLNETFHFDHLFLLLSYSDLCWFKVENTKGSLLTRIMFCGKQRAFWLWNIQFAFFVFALGFLYLSPLSDAHYMTFRFKCQGFWCSANASLYSCTIVKFKAFTDKAEHRLNSADKGFVAALSVLRFQKILKDAKSCLKIAEVTTSISKGAFLCRVTDMQCR